MSTTKFNTPFYAEIESQIGTGDDRAKNLRRVAFTTAATYLKELMTGDSTILPNEVSHELICKGSAETISFDFDLHADMCHIIMAGIEARKKQVETVVGDFHFDAEIHFPCDNEAME